jgi:hypothetical protein
LNEYYEGAVRQLIERGHILISMIPRGLPREFHRLEDICRNRLAGVLDELKELITDPRMLAPGNQPERLRQYKRAISELDLLETVCITALERAKGSDDKHLNRLIEAVRHEISYPILPPVVTPLSQSYFQTYPAFNLMLVPLSEGHFLLHLPDMYHELAHPLLMVRYDRLVQPFQDAFIEVIDDVTVYIENELESERRRGGPPKITFYLERWLRSWAMNWATEFFCDLFAVYTLGPAFAWSHLHLSATRGEDPYKVPTLGGSRTHPADGARMSALLYGLTLTGFGKEAAEIEGRWNELITAAKAAPDPDYRRCFPDSIIKSMAEKALAGVRGIKCRVAEPVISSPVHDILNQAWGEFWRDPARYASWEKNAVEELRKVCIKAAS